MAISPRNFCTFSDPQALHGRAFATKPLAGFELLPSIEIGAWFSQFSRTGTFVSYVGVSVIVAQKTQRLQLLISLALHGRSNDFVNKLFCLLPALANSL